MLELRLTRAVRRGRLLGLGEDVAHGDRLAGPGLEDPRARNPQGRVLLVSRHNQGVERGIPEDLPPVLQMVVLDAGIIRLDPFRSHGCRRPAVVGPDLEAIVNPLPGAGHDASAIEQDRDHKAGQRRPAPMASSRNSTSIMPAWKSRGHPSFPSCSFRSRLPARERRPRQIENDPHKRNYRQARPERLKIKRKDSHRRPTNCPERPFYRVTPLRCVPPSRPRSVS